MALFPLDGATDSEPSQSDGMPPVRASWPVDGIEDLINRIDEGADIVAAHSRLLARSNVPSPKWWSPDLPRVRRDARLIAGTDLGPYGLRSSPPISRVIQAAEHDKQRGRVTFGAVAVFLFLLLLEATISMFGYSQANAARAEAEVEGITPIVARPRSSIRTERGDVRCARARTLCVGFLPNRRRFKCVAASSGKGQRAVTVHDRT